MIRLQRETEPYEIDLGDGVTVKVKPLTYAVYRASTYAAERQAQELAQQMGAITSAGGRVFDIPDPLQRENFFGLRDQFALQALARHAIISWVGVFDEDMNPAPVTEQSVDAFVRDAVVHAQRFEARYMLRIAGMISEGEGSGAEPNGTSEAAPNTVDSAEKTTIHVPMESQAQTESVAPPA